MDRLPIHFDMDEVARLHSVAYAAAIQTGAKGQKLDGLTSQIFLALAEQANGTALAASASPRLSLVQ
jgi:hypothetical protein